MAGKMVWIRRGSGPSVLNWPSNDDGEGGMVRFDEDGFGYITDAEWGGLEIHAAKQGVINVAADGVPGGKVTAAKKVWAEAAAAEKAAVAKMAKEAEAAAAV